MKKWGLVVLILILILLPSIKTEATKTKVEKPGIKAEVLKNDKLKFTVTHPDKNAKLYYSLDWFVDDKCKSIKSGQSVIVDYEYSGQFGVIAYKNGIESKNNYIQYEEIIKAPDVKITCDSKGELTIKISHPDKRVKIRYQLNSEPFGGAKIKNGGTVKANYIDASNIYVTADIGNVKSFGRRYYTDGIVNDKARKDMKKLIDDLVDANDEDYMKLFKVYTWIRDTTDSTRHNDTRFSSTASIMFDKSGVSTAYASFMSDACDVLGIESAFSYDEENKHLSNIVKLSDGKWYFISADPFPIEWDSDGNYDILKNSDYYKFLNNSLLKFNPDYETNGKTYDLSSKRFVEINSKGNEVPYFQYKYDIPNLKGYYY